jgi:hypothetical protein
MKRLLFAVLLSFPTTILAQDSVGVSILSFGADASGQSDVSDALNRAIAVDNQLHAKTCTELYPGDTELFFQRNGQCVLIH